MKKTLSLIFTALFLAVCLVPGLGLILTGGERTAPRTRAAAREPVSISSAASRPAAPAPVKENIREMIRNPCCTEEARNIAKPRTTASSV